LTLRVYDELIKQASKYFMTEGLIREFRETPADWAEVAANGFLA
jgi:hypothetical protein